VAPTPHLVDLLCKIHSVVDVLHPQPRWRLFGTSIDGVKYLPPQLVGMVQSDTDADMVEIELGNVDNIRVPADALEDALDGLPDEPEDEVAMVTDTVIVTGDGRDDGWVRVLRPSDNPNIGADVDSTYYHGYMSNLYDMIDDARTLDGAEYVRENIAGAGWVTVKQHSDTVYLLSYFVGDGELRRAVEDDRMEVWSVEATQYQSDDGVVLRLTDTEAE